MLQSGTNLYTISVSFAPNHILLSWFVIHTHFLFQRYVNSKNFKAFWVTECFVKCNVRLRPVRPVVAASSWKRTEDLVVIFFPWLTELIPVIVQSPWPTLCLQSSLPSNTIKVVQNLIDLFILSLPCFSQIQLKHHPMFQIAVVCFAAKTKVLHPTRSPGQATIQLWIGLPVWVKSPHQSVVRLHPAHQIRPKWTIQINIFTRKSVQGCLQGNCYHFSFRDA